jgi:hypothetical protein
MELINEFYSQRLARVCNACRKISTRYKRALAPEELRNEENEFNPE